MKFVRIAFAVQLLDSLGSRLGEEFVGLRPAFADALLLAVLTVGIS